MVYPNAHREVQATPLKEVDTPQDATSHHLLTDASPGADSSNSARSRGPRETNSPNFVECGPIVGYHPGTSTEPFTQPGAVDKGSIVTERSKTEPNSEPNQHNSNIWAEPEARPSKPAPPTDPFEHNPRIWMTPRKPDNEGNSPHKFEISIPFSIKCAAPANEN